MDDGIGFFICGFVSGVVVMMLIGFLFIPPSVSKAEVIKHNAAEYVVVDPATGRTEFRWKDTPAPQPVKEGM